MHLGGAFARRGLRVLLVDNDPQSSLTRGLIGDKATRELDPATTLYALYAELAVDPAELIRSTSFDNLALLAGTPHCGIFNVPSPHRADPVEQERLVDGLAELNRTFDLILVDCAPCLQFNTWAALVTADAALIPVQPELYGAQGVAEVRDWVYLIGQVRGRPLPVAGVVVTMLNSRRSMHKVFVERLRSEYPEVLDAFVPESTDYPEAIASLQPVQWAKPRSAATRAMAVLADEVLTRLAELGMTVSEPQRKEVA